PSHGDARMIRINDVDVFDTPEELLDPQHATVLVIDMQNETASEEGGYAQHGYDMSRMRSIIPAIQRILEASRRLNLLIVFTEFVHRDRRGVTLVDGPGVYLHRLEKWISDVSDGSWAARTLDELAPQRGELIMQKSRASALYGTYLDNIFRSREVRTVLLMGCLTDGCVLKTAVDVTEHGYYPAVVKDAVNSLTAEKHELGLKYIEMKFPTFSSDEVMAVWAGFPHREKRAAAADDP